MGIRGQLNRINCEVVFSPIQSTYGFNPIPTSPTDFDSLVFFKQMARSNEALLNQLAAADLVIINGEGTIHHLTRPSVILLYIAYVTRKYINKPVIGV